MIVQLDATMSQAAINSEVIRDLVNQTHHVPLEQLEDLRNQARILQDGNLEIQILHRVATEIHWTNQRLNDLWRLASSNQHVDLAWRAATVLSARKALSINGRQAWAICGENRSEYSFQTPDLDVIKCCMDGFSESEKKLIQGIITVGPAIPELLQALSMRKSSIFEISANQLIKNSSRLDEFIDSIPFFKGIKFSGHLNAPERINPLTIPPFIHSADDSVWSQLLLRLANRLGINNWGWELSRLVEAIEPLVVKQATGAGVADAKVQKWIRKLNGESRLAWCDLAASAKFLSDGEAALVLGRFVIRLATAIYPHNYEALKSLHKMRVPIHHIWSLESWILSEANTEIRKRKRINSRIPIPIGLRNGNSILLEHV